MISESEYISLFESHNKPLCFCPYNDYVTAYTAETKSLSIDKDKYFQFMDNILMVDRKTPQQIRDGCILSGLFNRIFNM